VLTFETSDSSHEPKTNPIEGKTPKIEKKNSKKKGKKTSS